MARGLLEIWHLAPWVAEGVSGESTFLLPVSPFGFPDHPHSALDQISFIYQRMRATHIYSSAQKDLLTALTHQAADEEPTVITMEST